MSHICPNSGEVCRRFDCEQALQLNEPMYCDVFIHSFTQVILSVFNAGGLPEKFDREYLNVNMDIMVLAMKKQANNFNIPSDNFINAVIRDLQTELALRNIPEKRRR